MTTTTAEQTDTSVGPDLNPGPPQNLPEVNTVLQDQRQFSLAVRRMLGLEDASDAEIELFFHVCAKSGLDPFNKEVYMIGRNTEVANWEPVNPDEPDGQKRKVVRWVTKYTIQTSINGFRKRAREIADGKGIKYTQDAPLWCGEDGVWREVWTDKHAPVAAKFVVYRDGEAYPFVAHYDEYVQMSGQPAGPNSMWKKMPRNQLRKCAEAGAIQAAFPDELGGLLLEDAVQEPTIIDLDDDGQPVEQQAQPKRRGGKGVGGLRDRAAAETAPPDTSPQVVEGEVEDPGQGGGDDQSQGAEPPSGATIPNDSGDQDPPAEKRTQSAMRKAVEKRMFGLIGQIEPELSRDGRIDVYRSIIGRAEVESTNDLSDVEVTQVGDQLYKWRESGALNNKINDILMAADAAAADEGSK